jgi:hypothetical protein
MENQGPGAPQDDTLSIIIALIVVVIATVGILQISGTIRLPGL